MTTLSYVDASALAKLALDEPGSAEMRRWYVEAERVVSSRIGLIETRRAIARWEHDPAHLDAVLRSVEILELDARIARAAADVAPVSLKTLDSIHLATALEFGDELGAFITFDDRLADAARAAGLPVVRPA